MKFAIVLCKFVELYQSLMIALFLYDLDHVFYSITLAVSDRLLIHLIHLWFWDYKTVSNFRISCKCNFSLILDISNRK